MPCQQRRNDENAGRRLSAHTPTFLFGRLAPSAADAFQGTYRSGHSAVTDLTVPEATGTPGAKRTRRVVTDTPSGADRLFNLVTLSAGVTVLVLLSLVGIFLLWQGRHAWAYSGLSFFTTTQWSTNTVHVVIGVAGLLFGTIVVALIAECIAVPMGVLAALFIAEYAPLGMRKILQGLIDLLAAIPSLLFGLWGFLTLQYQIVPLFALADHLLRVDSDLQDQQRVQSLELHVHRRDRRLSYVRPDRRLHLPGRLCADPAGGEGSCLGPGRHEVGNDPHGRAALWQRRDHRRFMLGLGRALGETIAVTLILPQVPLISSHILEEGGGTIAGFIAQRAGSDPFTVSGLMAAGLILFGLTLITNLIASTIVARSRSGAGVDL